MGFYDAIRVGASGGTEDYTVNRSVRFNGQYETNAQQFRRTGTSTVSTYTISMWAKNCGVGTGVYRLLFSIGQENDANAGWVGMADGDHLYFQGGNGTHSTSTEKFRDPSAWFHFLISVNSNNFTVYINGTSIKTGTIRSLDTSTNGIRIGVNYGNYYPWDGYIADYYLIDGQALTPSSFTKTNAETGQLVPKLYTGSFGTEGAHLTFEDNSGITATTLGKDSSGNGNNYTPSGDWSVSAGTGNDSVEDTPTNNFATWHPLYTSKQTGGTTAYREGNLKLNTTTGSAGSLYPFGFTSFGATSGKWYAEFKCDTTSVAVGIANNGQLDSDVSNNPYGAYANTSFIYTNSGEIRTNNGNLTNQASYGSGDIIGVAMDLDNMKLYFHKNGTYINSGNPSTGSNGYTIGALPSGKTGDYVFSCGSNGASSVGVFANLGQQAFSYSIPTGYKKLNSANLPDPTILLPNKHFDTLLYTGNNGTQNITGLNFDPDWVWAKNRQDAGYHHDLYDAVRGDNLRLFSSQNNAEATGYLQFGVTGGFSLTAGGGINTNAKNHVAWNWNAGETDSKTYTVKVVSDSGNKYRFDNFGTSAVTLDLAEGGTYIFNMDDSSNASHPFSIGTAANGTVYTSGITYFLDGVSKTYSQYTSGFSAASTRRLHITVPASAPVLYYWCSVHSGMGGQINTNSTLGSSNFDGSRQATTKVNTTSGFSIISWTGTGSAFTLGHGLGVAPKVYIVKARTGSSGCDWFVYHKHIAATNNLRLNNTSASSAASDLFNNTEPTSSVLSIGDSSCINENNGTYITYAFSEVAGYSKFGSYEGNGSSDGTFVFTGFRPAWVVVKRYDGSGQAWNIFDNKRNTFNLVDEFLIANSANAEATGGALNLDFLSNGFKFRGTDGGSNASGSDYIYLAFAESPFKNARAR